jgi:hypothetical protein
MGNKGILNLRRKHAAAQTRRACVFAGALLLTSALAAAQDAASSSQKENEGEGFFATIGRWFDEQAANVNSSFKDARKKVEGFGRNAGDAAKTTVEGAKDAADVVVRIPAARPVSGHEKCRLAPNGAPDCVAAANAMCKAKGFDSGRSLDMTTAEVCPPKVWMAGRSSGPECRTETFVSRAFCQ